MIADQGRPKGGSEVDTVEVRNLGSKTAHRFRIEVVAHQRIDAAKNSTDPVEVSPDYDDHAEHPCIAVYPLGSPDHLDSTADVHAVIPGTELTRDRARAGVHTEC
ncbi:MAG: hypothetical protein H7290_02575 [Flavobacterium sp.]|nr:hypothetical protein [Aeromicrobium sp.]